MKQEITKEQWKELTRNQEGIFWDWLVDRGYHHKAPTIPIGQMIEFLKGKKVYDDFKRPYTFVEIFWSDLRTEWVVRFDSEDGGSCMEHEDHKELCDALWEAVKDVLSSQEDQNEQAQNIEGGPW